MIIIAKMVLSVNPQETSHITAGEIIGSFWRNLAHRRGEENRKEKEKLWKYKYGHFERTHSYTLLPSVICFFTHTNSKHHI